MVWKIAKDGLKFAKRFFMLNSIHRCKICGYYGKFDFIVSKPDYKILFIKCRVCGAKEKTNGGKQCLHL